ncbi:hypothetical protein WR25_03586 [Diploscapter pachys]|uniref:Uncharacterized protein n=1 Tax=Diploscapter pachys TaxID=2018661 RepID=A0A2A2LGL9_9BILA|nr:hypothetical protein WR25_03586 [Diploscapter pachys]
MRQPLRSQSFKHRPKPLIEVRRMAVDDGQERRRSTPTLSRRTSLQRNRVLEPRTDVWPEAKHREIEERFLKLPDAEDYTRVRQFNIDEKGTVVSRGDSFRRKRNVQIVEKHDKNFSPTNSAGDSRSASVISSEESARKENEENNPTTSHASYKASINVLGESGTGKTSLIGQLITSEYKNAFADEIQNNENTVSISIGGTECDLTFCEQNINDPEWLRGDAHAILIVYAIDCRSSWREALLALEMAKESKRCCNVPVLVAGNKADLERKRTVSKAEVLKAKAAFGFEHFEISVALNHDVDDLLVGLVAEIQEQYCPQMNVEKPSNRSDDFHSAIRRYSQRKKKEIPSDIATGKCSVLSPSSLFSKLKTWRRALTPN